MVKWEIVYTKQAQNDAKKISKAGLRPQVEKILKILKKNPFQTTPAFEKLTGDLSGVYSRRINIQHRFVYQVYEDKKIVKVIRMSYYEEVIMCIESAVRSKQIDPDTFFARIEALQKKITIPALTDDKISDSKEQGRP